MWKILPVSEDNRQEEFQTCTLYPTLMSLFWGNQTEVCSLTMAMDHAAWAASTTSTARSLLSQPRGISRHLPLCILSSLWTFSRITASQDSPPLAVPQKLAASVRILMSERISCPPFNSSSTDMRWMILWCIFCSSLFPFWFHFTVKLSQYVHNQFFSSNCMVFRGHKLNGDVFIINRLLWSWNIENILL